ncbi:hypothetical protein HYV73_03290 [Candidatus Uhrbacteria bacterium]|nr:hypothetical protein [Candidatus Uhrbacteria bacterium]
MLRKAVWVSFLGVSTALLFQFVSVAFAAILTSYSVTPSAQSTGEVTNHVVRFVTPTGVDSSTDTVKLVYEAGWDLTALSSPLDFDFAVDDDGACDGPFTDETLAVAAAAGIWGVGIAGQEIAFTPPTDAAAGEIPGGRCVQIEVGTISGFGGAGVNQIVNPAVEGNFEVAVTGGFGDANQAAISIVSDDEVEITASVGAAPPPGGGGGCSDTVAPLFINPSISGITPTSAVVSWSTNENANDQVSWGVAPTPPYDGTLFSGSLVIAHSYNLTGLTPGMDYEARITSEDFCNNFAALTLTFHTPYTTDPLILAPHVNLLSCTEATVVWDTNRPTTGSVVYGLTPLYGLGPVLSSTPALSHAVTLSGLSPQTAYRAKIAVTDQDGNTNESTDLVFQTPDCSAVVSLVLDVTPGLYLNNLAWYSPSGFPYVDTVIVYRLDRYPVSIADGTFLYDGPGSSLMHPGIVSGQEYFYAAFASDSNGSFAPIALDSGIPFGLPPITPITVTVTPGFCQNSLTWTLPPPLVGARVVYRTDTYPADENDGTVLYDGASTTFVHSSAVSGTTYYYGVFGYDSVNQFYTGAFTNATPVCPSGVPVLISNPRCEDVSYNSLTWAWETNIPADGDVLYGADPNNKNVHLVNNAYVISHSFPVTGLQQDTTYTARYLSQSGALSDQTGDIACKTLLQTNGFCGDFICGLNEDLANCIIDCPASCTGPGCTPVCGDFVCGIGEDLANCIIDCPAPCTGPNCVACVGPGCSACTGPGCAPVCGDLVCGIGEDPASCVRDCPLPCVGSACPICVGPGCTIACGNGFCGKGESILTCPVDCTAFPLRPGELSGEENHFLVQSETIELPLQEIRFRAVVDTDVQVRLIPDEGTKAIEKIDAYFSTSSSSLVTDDRGWVGTLRVPAVVSNYALLLLVTYQDRTQQSFSYVLEAQPRGRLVWRNQDGIIQPLSGASARLYVREFGLDRPMNIAAFFQQNPLETPVDGSFYWYVPAGRYSVEGVKDLLGSGWSPVEDDGDRIINPQIMIPGPELSLWALLSGIADGFSFMFVPLSAISIGFLLLQFQLWPFLQLLFTQPLRLFFKRKRKGYGVVYHSGIKLPVELAVVRLLRLPDAKVVRTRVTGKDGMYEFLADPGEYQIEVTKPEFSFPSEWLKKVRTDGEYLDVYHGEVIRVTDKNAVISANIPLDPILEKGEKEALRIRWKRRLRRLESALSWASVVLALVVLILHPSAFTIGVFILQVVLLVLVFVLVRPRKPKSWGIVYDKSTKKPLRDAVIRVFEPLYNKLIDSRLTDRNGRYHFLLGPNEYYATFEKEGYQTTEVRPIDYRSIKQPELLSMRVDMSPLPSGTAQHKPSPSLSPAEPDPAPPDTLPPHASSLKT